MLWYLLNIGIIIVFIGLFLITRNTNKRWSKINDYLGMVTNTVDSVRYGNLSTKIEQIHHPTYQNVTDSINRMVETLNDREHMIVEYQTELMRQNKLLFDENDRIMFSGVSEEERLVFNRVLDRLAENLIVSGAQDKPPVH